MVRETIYDSLDDEKLAEIDSICTNFELAVGENRAEPIETIVARHSPDLRLPLEFELIAAEVQLRLTRGESFSPESYVDRFPQWDHDIRCLFAVTGETFCITNGSEDTGQDILLPYEFGQYRLIRQIGRGGMGTVFQAEHRRLHKSVALKLLNPAIMSNPMAVARFQREMHAIGQLDHPHIVRALDAGEIDDVHYLTMEFVEGIDLRELCLARESLKYQDACELICQAAEALQQAADLDMVHRDIKPSNLILARPGGSKSPPILRLLDLGLALLEGQTAVGEPRTEAADRKAPPREVTAHGVGDFMEGPLSLTGSILGTVDYMAPEQARQSQSVDIRADIYALGATLYRLVAGHPPVQGPPLYVMRQKSEGNFTALNLVCPSLPPKLVAAVHRMLMPNPDDRFSSPSDVIKALAPFRRGADLANLIGTLDGPLPVPTPEVSKRLLAPSMWMSLIVIAAGLFAISKFSQRVLVNGTMRSSSVSSPPAIANELRSSGDSALLNSHKDSLSLPSPSEADGDATALVPFSAQRAKSLQQYWSDYLQVPIERSDNLGHGIALTTVLVPPGEFMMGPQPDWDWKEKKRVAQVAVQLSWYRIGKFEVTREQWDAVCRNAGLVKTPLSEVDHSGMPIGNVSHADATRYCQLLNEQQRQLGALPEGWEFALPTEAQWEFACRAGTITRSSFGNDLAPEQANIRIAMNSQTSGLQRPVAVGRYPANAFGLHDMHGNQWEWCRDVFSSALIGGAEPLQQGEGRNRPLRGGGWADAPTPIRWTSAHRYGRGAEQRFPGVGFRVALTRVR